MNILYKVKDIITKISYIMTAQQKKYALFMIIATLFVAVFETIGVSVIVPLVNALTEPEKLRNNSAYNVFFVFFDVRTDTEIVLIVILGVIIVYVTKNLFFIFYTWLKLKFSCKIQRECSVKMFSAYLSRDYMFFLNNNVNELLQGTSGDISALYGIIQYLFQSLTQLAIIIFIIIYMLYTDFVIAVGIVASSGICLVIVTLFFKNRMFDAGNAIRKYTVELNKTLLETFNGIKEVIVMNKKSSFINRYEKTVRKKQKNQIIQGIGAEIPAYIIEAVCIVGIMMVLALRVVNSGQEENFIATLASFAVGAFRILPGLGKLSVSINGITSYIPSLNTLYKNIKEVDEYGEAYPDRHFSYNGRHCNTTLNIDFERIIVDNVSFGYNVEKNGFVLDGINLEICRGQSVALIGETGSGKSTLADIILGVLKPNKGQIKLDNVCIDDIWLEWVGLIGFVPQSIYLSDTSIRENVAFGDESNSIDDERVRSALEEADILGFVDKLPDGIYTEIGDRGVRLSGGQCQRIGIARALYRRPQVLVLDEATSALDNETEKVVMQTIEKLHGKMTLIIIAHRLTTIRECDLIYEVKRGHVFERKIEEIL